ncbi:MAG: laccase domain-containing protein [Bacteroidales bacterium]|nr:laccase domain-containing protein [Bacteroidales bacterium]
MCFGNPYDPVMQVAGIAHAGWKGTVSRIAAQTFESMQILYKSKPGDILACIGPCISGESLKWVKRLQIYFKKSFRKIQVSFCENQNGPNHTWTLLQPIQKF